MELFSIRIQRTFQLVSTACVLHFEFGMAFGAGAAFKGVA